MTEDERMVLWINDALNGSAALLGERVQITLKLVDNNAPWFAELFNAMVKGIQERASHPVTKP